MGLQFITVFLLLSMVLVLATKRLGLGSILGYLFTGILMGPSGMGVVKEYKDILAFSEIGLLLFMFLIGLELRPNTLWKMKFFIFVIGSLQVVITTLVFFGIMYMLGFPMATCIIISMGLSLSSTTLVLTMLKERNLLTTSGGKLGFSVLLFQDIVVVFMMTVVTLAGTLLSEKESFGEGFSFYNYLVNAWQSIVSVVGMTMFIFVIGKYLIKYLFQFITKSKLEELTTAFALLIVLATGFMMNSINYSMSLGSFIAGVLLADSEFKYVFESNIKPFKGLLVGMFFAAIGMSLDFTLVLSQPFKLVQWLVIYIVIKMIIIMMIAYVFKFKLLDSLLCAVLLSEGGEFAFVLNSQAVIGNIISHNDFVLFNLIITISMVLTPFFYILYEKYLLPYFGNRSETTSVENNYPVEHTDNKVILLGCGRFGSVVLRILNVTGIGITILDRNPQIVDQLARNGIKAFCGDASSLAVLRSAGAENASLIIITNKFLEKEMETVNMIKINFPEAKILMRAASREEAIRLKRLGVDSVYRETFNSSVELAREALSSLDISKDEASKTIDEFIAYDRNLLNLQVKSKQDIRAVSDGMFDKAILEKLIEKDRREFSSRLQDKENGE